MLYYVYVVVRCILRFVVLLVFKYGVTFLAHSRVADKKLPTRTRGILVINTSVYCRVD
jgi:hypothetical protein